MEESFITFPTRHYSRIRNPRIQDNIALDAGDCLYYILMQYMNYLLTFIVYHVKIMVVNLGEDLFERIN